MHKPRAASIAALAERIVTLKLLPRTGWLQRGVAAAESVAEHSFGVAALALIFAATDPTLDRSRLLAIAIIHDMAEALLGDLPLTARRLLGEHTKRDAEYRALAELFAAMPERERLVELWQDYASGVTREARLVKALDRAETLAQALAYERAGNDDLGEFWRGATDGLDEFPDVVAFITYLQTQRRLQANG